MCPNLNTFLILINNLISQQLYKIFNLKINQNYSGVIILRKILIGIDKDGSVNTKLLSMYVQIYIYIERERERDLNIGDRAHVDKSLDSINNGEW